MKHVIKLSLTLLCITFFGAVQAHDPSKTTQDDISMEMPVMKGAVAEESNAESVPDTLENQAKHDHREFKGLPSAPAKEVSGDEKTGEPEGHDHRKQNR